MTAALAPRRPWAGRHVVLGVTGGIAAYKSVQLARDLTLPRSGGGRRPDRGGAAFRGAPLLPGCDGSPAALGPLRLRRRGAPHPPRARGRRRVRRSGHGRLPGPGRPRPCRRPPLHDAAGHPGARGGLPRDERPDVLPPPGPGEPASTCGTDSATTSRGRPRAAGRGEGEGPGRMLEPWQIEEHVGRALGRDAALVGRARAGDGRPDAGADRPVRYVGNRSSGRMGYALAQAAWRRGARVVLVSGPSALPPPEGVEAGARGDRGPDARRGRGPAAGGRRVGLRGRGGRLPPGSRPPRRRSSGPSGRKGSS